VTLDKVFLQPSTDLPNTVIVTGRGSNCSDPATAPSTPACHVVTVVPAVPYLVASKSVDKTTANPGDTLNYTLTLKNTGSLTTTSTVTDDLTPLLPYIVAPTLANLGCTPACTLNGNVVTWANQTVVAQGATLTFTFHVTVANVLPAASNSLINTVGATGSNCPADTANCQVTTTVEAAPNLSLVKEVAVGDSSYGHSGPANPGDVLTYRLTITNTGTLAATDETVTDDLSAVLAHATWNDSASASSGSTSLVGSTLNWFGISIPAGGSAVLTFSVTLDTTGWTAGQTDLPNTAIEVNSTNCSSIASATSDCSTDTTVITGTDVRITKAVNPSTIPGGASSAVGYTIVVSNDGTGTTNGHVLVTDNDFPAFYSITGVVCSPTSGTCDAAHLTGSGIDLGQLAAGASVTITVTGTASPNNGSDVGSHVNTAYACEQVVEGSPVCVHAPATLTVTLTHTPAIHIVKTPSATVLQPGGGSVTYTYAVTNTGNVPLSNVTVTDDKCSPVTYESGDANNNHLLDLTETWMFDCTSNLTATTTNVATATGHDGDTTVTDTDTATVTVPEVTPTPTPTPTLPLTPGSPTITLPPTSTVDGAAPASQPGSSLLLLLVAIGGITLLAGYLIPAPARSRRRNRRS
jgi:large repetitive protein